MSRLARAAGLAVAVGAATVLPGFLVGALALQMRGDLDASVGAVAAGVTVFFLAGAFGAGPGGRLAERLGALAAMRAAVLITAGCLFAIAALAGSLRPGVRVLRGGRAGQRRGPAGDQPLHGRPGAARPPGAGVRDQAVGDPGGDPRERPGAARSWRFRSGGGHVRDLRRRACWRWRWSPGRGQGSFHAPDGARAASTRAARSCSSWPWAPRWPAPARTPSAPTWWPRPWTWGSPRAPRASSPRSAARASLAVRMSLGARADRRRDYGYGTVVVLLVRGGGRLPAHDHRRARRRSWPARSRRSRWAGAGPASSTSPWWQQPSRGSRRGHRHHAERHLRGRRRSGPPPTACCPHQIGYGGAWAVVAGVSLAGGGRDGRWPAGRTWRRPGAPRGGGGVR